MCPATCVFFQITISTTYSTGAPVDDVIVAADCAPVTVSVEPDVHPRGPPPDPFSLGSITR